MAFFWCEQVFEHYKSGLYPPLTSLCKYSTEHYPSRQLITTPSRQLKGQTAINWSLVKLSTELYTVLWFAFILLYLSYWEQQNSRVHSYIYGCDLLSFYYLCRTGNNNPCCCCCCCRVVICFHFTIFVVLETTFSSPLPPSPPLWFAFILLSLSYWKQRKPPRCTNASGCDLLSFYYLCRTGNNRQSDYNALVSVVICFHFTIFVVLETTNHISLTINDQLWFAFILLSLSYWKQPYLEEYRTRFCCDLLSFYYLCRTGNN